ncbi:MAG: type VI secretion system contractile sheath small subunit [Rhodospirillaceae bacterium]
MSESIQHKLDRVRPPRVQITYDVETGGAIEKKELPFVVGVMADLSGTPDADNPAPKLKERKFIEIDRDNFNEVMKKSCKPRLEYSVDNRLKDDGGRLGVSLTFNSIEDFEPIKVINQIDPLAKLFRARQLLAELRTKLDGNDALGKELADILKDEAQTTELKKLLATPADPSAPEA